MMHADQFGKGAIRRGPDSREVQYSSIYGGNPVVDWSHDYDFLKEIGLNIPIKNQGRSSSCVGQATSYLAETAEFVETKTFTQLSAEDIYSRIYLSPDGGAYGYKGPSTVVTRGVARELLVPSYENGLPPSEAFMRIQNNSPMAIQDALIHKGKNYATINTNSIEEISYAIEHQGCAVFGVVGTDAGWSGNGGFARPPLPGESQWGHYLFATKRLTLNGKRYISGPNSWSEQWGSNGFFFVPESYFDEGFTFNAYTLVDLPNTWYNQINMLRIIKTKDGVDQYTVQGKQKNLIPDAATLGFLIDQGVVTGQHEDVSQAELDSFNSGKAWASQVVDSLAHTFYEGARDSFEKNQ